MTADTRKHSPLSIIEVQSIRKHRLYPHRPNCLNRYTDNALYRRFGYRCYRSHIGAISHGGET